MTTSPTRDALRGTTVLLVALLVVIAAACGGSDDDDGDAVAAIVVTTTVWADVVDSITCNGLAEVTALVGPDVDPVDYEPTAGDGESVDAADLVVANGLGLEAGLAETISAAGDDGTPVLEIGSLIDPLDGVSGPDPHFWLDAQRVIAALPSVADAVVDATSLDAATVEECLNGYLAELAGVDAQVVEMLGAVPADRREIITTLDSLGYFAERHGFAIAATVTVHGAEGPNPASIDELGGLVSAAAAPVVLAGSGLSSGELLELARQSDEVEVVGVQTMSLGVDGEPDDTYFGFLVTTAATIAEALTAT